MADVVITFRRLAHDDLPFMQRWLDQDHVRRWWDSAGSSIEALAAKYEPRIDGQSPIEPFIVSCDGAPIGYIQLCGLWDFPEHAARIGVGDGAAGIDIFIGEPAYVYRGLGARILRTFLRDVAFTRAGIDVCTVDPSPQNRSAIRAYEKAGFAHLRTVCLPGESEPAYIMAVGRPTV